MSAVGCTDSRWHQCTRRLSDLASHTWVVQRRGTLATEHRVQLTLTSNQMDINSNPFNNYMNRTLSEISNVSEKQYFEAAITLKAGISDPISSILAIPLAKKIYLRRLLPAIAKKREAITIIGLQLQTQQTNW